MRTSFGLSLRHKCVKSLRPVFALLLAITMVAIVGFQAPAAAASKYAGFVIDAKTGKVLYASQADARRYPASLTKMMTLYLVFEDLKRGKISRKTRIRMTRNASRQPPSKLGLKPGRTLSVEQAIYALVTKSANDVATAIGENLSGSEPAFARRMTKKARQLGMTRTIFKNAHGLPNRQQVTTARDMSKLGLALREHFPREFRYFQTRSFKYGRKRYRNHNRLLGKIKGVDGIKTGYTRASGFNLVSSVSRGNRRIVAVVLGGKTGRSRNAQMAKLIKKYLPRASRGRAKVLIAKAQPPRKSLKRPAIRKQAPKTRVLTASVALPTSKPILAQMALPARKPLSAANPLSARKSTNQKFTKVADSRIQIAHETGASAYSSSYASNIRAKLIELAATSMPLTVPSQRKFDNTHTGSLPKSKQMAMNADEPSPRTGWQIQIGATPNRNSAEKLLSKARKKAKVLLASASDYLEPVAKGNTTLIRARFTGFSSKGSARRACKYLKRRKFACLAIKQ